MTLRQVRIRYRFEVTRRILDDDQDPAWSLAEQYWAVWWFIRGLFYGGVPLTSDDRRLEEP